MIRFIHNHKQSIGIVFLIVAAAFAFTGVGIDALHRGTTTTYAVKVNDREFSFQEIAVAEQQVSRQYGQGVPADQIVDMLVSQTLIEQESHNKGFRVSESDERLSEIISQQFFPTGAPTREQYINLLQNMGMSPSQFEKKVKSDRLVEMYVGLISDVSFATGREARAELAKQETEATLSAVEFKPADLLKEVPAPTDAEIQKHFEDTATEYELPARASYDYIVFDPKNFKQAVPVNPQDVEMFYSENSAKFVTPEQAKLRSIKVLYPKDSDPVKMASAREKATKAHEEAVSGKPFAGLVTAYSDDIAAKATGGDLGWMEVSKLEDSVAEAVMKLKGPGVADLVELDYGFQIIQVEEYKASTPKALSEVTGEIENLLRDQEAPSFANAEAYRLMELAKSGKPLTELATEAKLPVASTNGLLSSDQDPTTDLKGLTAKVITLSVEERKVPSLQDVGDATVLVAVKEIKDPSTAPFETVKDRVTEALRKARAETLAKTKANEFLEHLKAQKTPDIAAAAKEKGYTVAGPGTIQPTKPGQGWLASPEIVTAAFNNAKANTVLGNYFMVGDTYVVAEVTSVKVPDLKREDPKVEQFRATASQRQAGQMIQSVLASVKTTSEVEIDPSLMARG